MNPEDVPPGVIQVVWTIGPEFFLKVDTLCGGVFICTEDREYWRWVQWVLPPDWSEASPVERRAMIHLAAFGENP